MLTSSVNAVTKQQLTVTVAVTIKSPASLQHEKTREGTATRDASRSLLVCTRELMDCIPQKDRSGDYLLANLWLSSVQFSSLQFSSVELTDTNT